MYLIKWNIYLRIKNESKVANEIKRITNLLELIIIDYSTSKKDEGYAVEFSTHCRSLLRNDAIVEAINLSSKLGSGWCILPIQSSNDWFSFEGINPSDFRLSSITWAHFVLLKDEVSIKDSLRIPKLKETRFQEIPRFCQMDETIVYHS